MGGDPLWGRRERRPHRTSRTKDQVAAWVSDLSAFASTETEP